MRILAITSTYEDYNVAPKQLDERGHNAMAKSMNDFEFATFAENEIGKFYGVSYKKFHFDVVLVDCGFDDEKEMDLKCLEQGLEFDKKYAELPTSIHIVITAVKFGIPIAIVSKNGDCKKLWEKTVMEICRTSATPFVFVDESNREPLENGVRNWGNAMEELLGVMEKSKQA